MTKALDTTSPIADVHALMQLRAIRDLTKALPMNDLGLPVGIYRTDLLPWHSYEAPNSAVPDHLQPKPQGDAASEHALQSDGKGGTIQQAQFSSIDDLGFDMPVAELDEPLVGVDVAEPNDDRTEYALVEVEEQEESSSNAEATYTPISPPVIRRIAGFIQSDLEAAFVWLHFDDGYPAFDTGEPFWNQFAFEPLTAYTAFQHYLQMPLGKPAGWDENEEEHTGHEASGMRSIGDLASIIPGNIGEDVLARQEQYRQYSVMYYWGLRAQAYDMFRVVQHHKRIEHRAIETQDEHYIDARKLRGRAMQYMETEDFWEMMTPKVAIDVLKTATGLERISAGMGASGPGARGEGNGREGGQSVEIAYRTIAQNNNTKGGQEGNLIEEASGEVFSKVLEDPEQAGMLQELIIKMTGSSHG